ncbi:T9SS type A sorting domain-containing protein [candidate division KSB1 bacterium]|nr:T9SS type A sorting domain-containing protein [candidate division KSB1 bacterium]
MKTMLLLLILSFFSCHLVGANSLIEERQFEPVVCSGWRLSAFHGIPVEEIYMYAFDQTSQKLEVIPFQIDERIKMPFEIDLRGTEKTFDRHYYASKGVKQAASGEWIDIVDDGKMDEDDELVFLVGDLGDPAPESAWADVNVENGLRKTLLIHDPNAPEKSAVGYLVHSREKKEIPSPYNFSYDKAEDVVANSQYKIKMSRPSGLISDIAILSGGSGVDIFDSQKIRLVGLIDLGTAIFTMGLNGLPAFNDRDNFYIFPETTFLSLTEKPRVRLVREVHQTIRADDLLFSILGISFFVNTKFYPYSGTLEGGASLNPVILKEMFGDTDDIFIQFNLVRQSWDFNQNASGMKFYNANNNGIVVDGAPDNSINKALVSTGNIREWSMISGNQGTMFMHLVINDTTYQKAELYYHDDQNGGQDDDSFVGGGDTGDGKSYGDNGIKIMESQSLDLGFTAYFLEKNKDKAFAERLAYNVENPVAIRSVTVQVKDGQDSAPQDFELAQNVPNPFNSSTAISFRVPQLSHIKIDIIDVNGHLVRRLLDDQLDAGQHKVVWDGRDASGLSAATGVYIYRIESKEYREAKKLLLVK